MAVPDRIGELLFRYLRSELTPAEKEELENWRTASPGNGVAFDELINPENIKKKLKNLYEREQHVWEKIIAKNPGLAEIKEQRNYTWYWAAAVGLLLLFAGTSYFLLSRKAEIKGDQAVAKISVTPGGNHAVLTLSNGSKIILDSTRNGAVASQGTSVITKKDSELVYIKGGGENGPTYNILTTPKGGQYKVSLDDGTSVWLNAASELKYPVHFSGGERKVALSGEAYFEVAKDKTKPFIVTINNSSQLEVLGTHFNIMAYRDEPKMEATLLEGKIKLDNVIIKPGQQAVKTNSRVFVTNDADTDAVVEWKNGQTSFNRASVGVIMRAIARWYNVEVEYAGNIPERQIMGGIPRNTSLDELLHVLAMNGIHVRAEGQKLIVSP